MRDREREDDPFMVFSSVHIIDHSFSLSSTNLSSKLSRDSVLDGVRLSFISTETEHMIFSGYLKEKLMSMQNLGCHGIMTEYFILIQSTYLNRFYADHKLVSVQTEDRPLSQSSFDASL